VAGTGGARCSALRRLETPEGEHWHYRYDVFGRRIAKFCSNPGEATRRRHGIRETYLWMADRLIESRRFGPDCDLLDTTLWHYRAERFDPLAREVLGADDSRCYPIASDPNGTPHTLYNSQGQIVWQAGHTLWGSPRERDYGSELQPTRYPETVPDCPLRFPGQWADPESGLHYNLHRYYDPHSGQYLSPDPIGLAGGLRTHAYVHDPLQWVDPWGLAECIKNKTDGTNRETRVGKKLRAKFGEENVLRERYLRDSKGKIVRDRNGKARRVDFVIKDGNGKGRAIEVTSRTAIKDAQIRKEVEIRQSGGKFVRDPKTRELIELTNISRIIRVR